MVDTKISALTAAASAASANEYAINEAGTSKKVTGTQITALVKANMTLTFTDYIPCTMEVPNDTVSYPDVFTLGDAATKLTGIWLPNSGTSALNFKCIVPFGLAGTPAGKILIYMLPRTTVANSTVNLTLSRLYVNDTEDCDAAYTAETAVDVNLTSTADFLTIYEYDLKVCCAC